MVIKEVRHPLLSDHHIFLSILRLDQIAGPLNGNKAFKLKYNLQEALSNNNEPLITFGGAFSNHLYAFAKACEAYSLPGLAFIRGDGMDRKNPTLQYLVNNDVEVFFLDRNTYRQKETTVFLDDLHEKYPEAYIIPEGGSNQLGFQGCQEILPENLAADIVTVSAGTGCTAAGIVSSTSLPVEIYVALKGGFMFKNIDRFLKNQRNFQCVEDYHFGGFAKTNKDLIEFINNFFIQTGIPLDPIYTGKMMYGIFDRIIHGKYSSGTKIMAIHTGGLQGIVGYNYLHKNNPILIPIHQLSL